MNIQLLKKEFQLLRVNGALLLSISLFSFLLAVVVSFSLRRIGAPSAERIFLTPGLLSISALLVVSVLFNQTALLEKEENALLGLRMSGFSGTDLFASKLIANFFLFVFLQCIFALSLGFLFEQELLKFFFQILFLESLAGVALCSLGTILSMISVVSPGREILFPVIFFPLVIPLLGAVTVLARMLFESGELDLWSFPGKLILSLAVLYTTLGALLFEEVI